MKNQRTAAAALTVSSVLLFTALVWDHPWSQGLLALLVGSFPVGLVHLATVGRPRGRRLRAALLILTAVLCGSLLALVVLDRMPSEGSLLGIPAALWIMLVGLTLVPLALVSWIYVATFGEEVTGQGQESRLPGEDEGGPT